jgi:hypothetical protein
MTRLLEFWRIARAAWRADEANRSAMHEYAKLSQRISERRCDLRKSQLAIEAALRQSFFSEDVKAELQRRLVSVVAEDVILANRINVR